MDFDFDLEKKKMNLYMIDRSLNDRNSALSTEFFLKN